MTLTTGSEGRWGPVMTDTSRGRGPISYQIRVLGHLDPHWSTWFTGLTLTQEDDGTTSLSGVVTDQAELHGLLAKVRDIGATLLSVTPVDTLATSPSSDTATGDTPASDITPSRQHQPGPHHGTPQGRSPVAPGNAAGLPPTPYRQVPASTPGEQP